MEKQIRTLMLLVLTLFMFTACSDDDDKAPDSMYLYSTSATVKADAGEISVSVYATCDWTVTPKADWVTVDRASGPVGIYPVHLIYEENTTGEPREAIVEFKAGAYVVNYTLTQQK